MTEIELEMERQRLARMSNSELLGELMVVIERYQQTEEGRAYLAAHAEILTHHISYLRKQAANALRREMDAKPTGNT